MTEFSELYEAASKGFHISETCGPDGKYHRISKFQTLAELQAFEDAWRKAMISVRESALSHAAGQDGEQCRAASAEDAYVIEQMGRLLAEIAVIVNGPEPAMTRWSYHDLPEKVRALQEQRGVAPEIPFLATPMTDHSEGSRLRWEYEKGWNACREYALRALSRGVPEGKCQHAWQPDPDVMNARYCPKCDVTQTIAAQRKEG